MFVTFRLGPDNPECTQLTRRAEGSEHPSVTPAAVPPYALVVMPTLLDFNPGEVAVT
jgi:hypothetical protein